MSDRLIKDDMPQELARLQGTNFFRDKPAEQTQAGYIYDVALKQAKRFGVDDYLAAHYARLAAYARMVGA